MECVTKFYLVVESSERLTLTGFMEVTETRNT